MINKIRNSFELQLNLTYCVAQGLYWMLYCCTISLASAFLIGKGFSTAGVGFLLALIFLIATIVQQLLSSFADSSKTISVLDILLVLGAVLFLALVFLLNAKRGFAIWFFFLIIGIVMTAIMPLLNALNFSMEKASVKMNFGVARSCGSLFFFVSSIIVGNLMHSVSVNAAPAFAVLCSVLFIADLGYIKYRLNGVNIIDARDYDPFEDHKNDGVFNVATIKAVLNKYKMFFVFLVGLIGFYFGHVLINSFFYQIVVNVGGNTADNGGVLALQAIVELPCMIFFEKLKDRFGTKILLGTSAVFFFLKILCTTLATSVGMLYFSVLFQALSFALLIPGTVHLVDEVMSEKDAVKGQAFVTMALTIANLLAAVLGGLIINFAGTFAALVFGTIVTLIGVVISIFGLVRIK